MRKIHVLLKKDELDEVRLNDKVVIVLDVLFATTTIISALANGAEAVIPVAGEQAARAAAPAHPHARGVVLAGELYAETIAGFASPTPLALHRHGVSGKLLVYSTTNGTVALTKAQSAPAVYAGALVNARALAEHILRTHAGNTILIVCSGSVDNFNLEDFWGAGYFVSLFSEMLDEQCELTDAALAARALFNPARTRELLLASRVGRMMIERDLVDEVEYAAQLSNIALVPRLDGSGLRSV